MANLEEQNNFDEGIYQIETDDVVIGGPEGVANKSAKNLANRTAWLKAQLALLNSALDSLSISDITNLSTELGFSKLEIDNAISAAGIAPDDDNVTQLADAIKKQIDDVRRNKNVLVDGRFDHWFESTSQTSNGYGSDTMWKNKHSGSTKVHTREALVLGVDIPDVPTAEFYSRTVVNSVAGSSNFIAKTQNIENVRSFAEKTVTVSLYARADSPKDIAVELSQVFGSGGSAVVLISPQTISLTTTFKRHDIQIVIPSIAGKTIGIGSYLQLSFWLDAGSDFNPQTNNLNQQSGTFDIACAQLESGGVVTGFEEEEMSVSLARVEWQYKEVDFSGALGTRIDGAQIYYQMSIGKMRSPPASSVSGFPSWYSGTLQVVAGNISQHINGDDTGILTLVGSGYPSLIPLYSSSVNFQTVVVTLDSRL